MNEVLQVISDIIDLIARGILQGLVIYATYHAVKYVASVFKRWMKKGF